MPLRPRSLALALLAAVAAAGFGKAAGPRPIPGGAEITTPAPGVAWSELAGFPCRQHGNRVRLTLQFHSLPARWSAGPTRFGPGAFAAVSAWADEQFPWFVNEFENPAARVFVRRGTDIERTFASATPHQRFEVEGYVREVWLDRPWIELVAATPLEEAIGEATVFHAARALELMEDGTFVIADEALQQALQQDALPPHAREALGRLREICIEEMADPKPAPIRPRGN